MKKFLCYDTNDAASGKINVDNRGMLKPNSTVPSGSTPYQQLVTDGNGNTVWEDRLAYSFEVTVEVLPKMSVSVATDEQDGLYIYRIDLGTTFETGKSYTVVFDETEYKVVAQFPRAIGNLSFIGAGQDTGEPFVVTSSGALGTKTSGEHSIQITCTGIVYHKLSSEYIQNGDVLRVHDKYTMTDEEAEAYHAAIDSNKSSFIVWGCNTFKDITRIGDGSGFIGLRLKDVSGKNYIVYKNDDGLYSIDDLFESELNLQLLKGGVANSYGISIKSKPDPIVIEPGSYLDSEPTENIVLLRVKNNGIKNVVPFEVLGNGTIKTRSVILPSSTSGSTKRFRITVDDTGTISATEVTS